MKEFHTLCMKEKVCEGKSVRKGILRGNNGKTMKKQ